MAKPKKRATNSHESERGAYNKAPKTTLRECRLCFRLKDPSDVYKIKTDSGVAYECQSCRKVADALSTTDPKPRTLALPRTWSPVGLTNMQLLAQHLSQILDADVRYSRRDFSEFIFMLDKPILIQDLIDLNLPTARISFDFDLDSTRYPMLILTDKDIDHLRVMPPVVIVMPQSDFDAIDERKELH